MKSARFRHLIQTKQALSLLRAIGPDATLESVALVFGAFAARNETYQGQLRTALARVFPERSASQRKSLARAIQRGAGLHFGEKLLNLTLAVPELKKLAAARVDVSGLDLVRTELAHGRGVLLATGHFGGYEFYPAFLAAHGIPVSALVKLPSDRVGAESRRKAAEGGLELIEMGQSRAASSAIVDSLRQGRVVIFTIDEIRRWRRASHEHLSFLGERVPVDQASSTLTSLAKCGAVYGAMHRTARHRYRFVIEPVAALRDKSRLPAQASISSLLIERLGADILREPEQWYHWDDHHVLARLSRSAAERGALTGNSNRPATEPRQGALVDRREALVGGGEA